MWPPQQPRCPLTMTLMDQLRASQSPRKDSVSCSNTRGMCSTRPSSHPLTPEWVGLSGLGQGDQLPLDLVDASWRDQSFSLPPGTTFHTQYPWLPGAPPNIYRETPREPRGERDWRGGVCGCLLST